MGGGFKNNFSQVKANFIAYIQRSVLDMNARPIETISA
jgi:hypothetical protein